MIICPLCMSKGSFVPINGPFHRVFQCCKKCKLVFSEKQFLPSKEEEKKRYMLHNNGLHNLGYVKFLNQAIEPVLPLLNKNARGLDYGCGPVPTLSLILKQEGINCEDYDPIFFNDQPEGTYDFIFATECFEHFFIPAKDLQIIKNLLNPGGLLIVMTELWKTPESFANWVYAKDPTHVTFYHSDTMKYIASKYRLEIIESNNNRVFVFKKE